MKVSTQQVLEYYSSIMALLFFALAVVIPKAIGTFPALILLIALPLLFQKETYANLDRNTLLLVGSFLFFGSVWIFNSWYFSESSSAYDKPSRFFAGVIVLLFLLRFPPKQHFIWLGIALGGIITGCWALWEKILLGSHRVDAFTNAIQYGNISILLSMLSLVGLGWAHQRTSHRFFWLSILSAGVLFGLLASGLSGSRGGWVGLIFVITYILVPYRRAFSKKVISSGFTFIISLLILLFLLPQTGIKNRVFAIEKDLVQYAQGNSLTSVGTRLELWRGSLLLIQDKPLTGWGESGYLDRITELKNENLIRPHLISHAHNEVLDTTSKRGIWGLTSLFILYLTPLYVFYHSRKHDFVQNSLPLMLSGGVVAISYIDFGLTQTFFEHNNGVMFYIFSLVFLYAALNHEQKLRSLEQAILVSQR